MYPRRSKKNKNSLLTGAVLSKWSHLHLDFTLTCRPTKAIRLRSWQLCDRSVSIFGDDSTETLIVFSETLSCLSLSSKKSIWFSCFVATFIGHLEQSKWQALLGHFESDPIRPGIASYARWPGMVVERLGISCVNCAHSHRHHSYETVCRCVWQSFVCFHFNINCLITMRTQNSLLL